MSVKTYHVTINNEEYEVVVEEVAAAPESVKAPVAKPAVKPAAVKAAQPQLIQPAAVRKEPVRSSSNINAPMPGTILDVRVKEGVEVKAGDVLFVLEAMKMENDITAVSSGVVASVAVSIGSKVATGDLLASLK